MVNARAPCDDDQVVKRIAICTLAAAALAACSQGSGREFARYYDPQGIFATNLPAANDLQVTPPQASSDGPQLLTGVVATPPQPSPSPQTGLGGTLVDTTTQTDQTTYQVLAVQTDGFADLDEMALYYLTGDPAIDVRVEDSVRIDGDEGRLLVTDVNQSGAATASLAVALTLGRDGTGFLVAAVFPPGEWEAERADFFRVLESFNESVPPGLMSFPVTGPAA
jgi:hypothetical protein